MQNTSFAPPADIHALFPNFSFVFHVFFSSSQGDTIYHTSMGASFLDWTTVGENIEVVYVENVCTPDAPHLNSASRKQEHMPVG